jgi:hypothetical protein
VQIGSWLRRLLDVLLDSGPDSEEILLAMSIWKLNEITGGDRD